MPSRRRERRRRRTEAGLQQHRSQRDAIGQTRRSTEPELVMDSREVIDGDGPRTVHLSGHCGSTVIDYSGEDFDFEQDHAPTYSVSFALRRQPVGTRQTLVPVVIRSRTDLQNTREGQQTMDLYFRLLQRHGSRFRREWVSLMSTRTRAQSTQTRAQRNDRDGRADTSGEQGSSTALTSRATRSGAADGSDDESDASGEPSWAWRAPPQPSE